MGLQRAPGEVEKVIADGGVDRRLAEVFPRPGLQAIGTIPVLHQQANSSTRDAVRLSTMNRHLRWLSRCG